MNDAFCCRLRLFLKSTLFNKFDHIDPIGFIEDITRTGKIGCEYQSGRIDRMYQTGERTS